MLSRFCLPLTPHATADDVALFLEGISTRRQGVTTHTHSPGLVAQRDLATGIITYEYLPRPFVITEPYLLPDGQEAEYAPAIRTVPLSHRAVDKKTGQILPHVETTRLAVFVPSQGLLVVAGDIFPGARRTALRYFPRATLVCAAVIDAFFGYVAGHFTTQEEDYFDKDVSPDLLSWETS